MCLGLGIKELLPPVELMEEPETPQNGGKAQTEGKARDRAEERSGKGAL